MKKLCFLVTLCMLLAALPLVSLAETMYIDTPNGGSVNLREGPSTDYDVLVSVGFGEPVEVIGMFAGSAWIDVNYNGYFGYIMARYLSPNPPMPGPLPTFIPGPTFIPDPTFYPVPTYVPAPTARPQPTAKPSGGSSLEKTLASLFAGFQDVRYDAIVVPSTPTTYVNLRWAPSKSAPVRSQYWAGNTLQVLSENGSWSEVYDPATGTHGFMMSSFLSPASVGGAGADS